MRVALHHDFVPDFNKNERQPTIFKRK